MKNTSSIAYGGIEAGGTKFICAIGNGPADIRDTAQFATTTPGETIGKVIEYFNKEKENNLINAIGIGSFGPLDINPCSPTYGFITNTPKSGWSYINIAGMVREALNIPTILDTDVNAAALGEQQWGIARGLNNLLYLTIGTGIGGGGIINGKLMNGLSHPEMGHIRIPHDYKNDPFIGSCPFHGDCFEGLASGESMNKRWGKPPEVITSDHKAWELEASYIGTGLANLICTLSPQMIILGGGVMKNINLHKNVLGKVEESLNNYFHFPDKRIDKYIVSPGLGDLSGVLGAIALAHL